MTNGEKQTEFKDENNPEIVKLREILSNLERIEPPSDFNFRLKARWQATKSETVKRPFFSLPNFAYSFGTLAFCVFGAWMALNFVSVKPAEKIASGSEVETVLPKDSAKPFSPINKVENETALPVETTKELPVKTVSKNQPTSRRQLPVSREITFNKSPNVTRKSAKSVNKDDEILTKDSAITNTPKSLTPKGIPDTINGEKGIKPAVLLDFLGIEAKNEGENLRVVDVKKGSRAKSAGLMKGDLIDKFNGKKPLEISAGEFNEVVLTVKRNGSSREIKLPSSP